MACSSVVCSRQRQLDPGLLERAVGMLVRAHPELGGLAAQGDPGAGAGTFVHLDLSASAVAEHRRLEGVVEWALGRCLDRATEAGFLVAYLDPGGDRQGCLVLAGHRSAVFDDRRCAALSDALLELYGELATVRRAAH